MPPLRQDSASCEHRKPANRGTALATAQGPGGSGGAASPGVTQAGDRLAETPRPPVPARPGEVGVQHPAAPTRRVTEGAGTAWPLR